MIPEGPYWTHLEIMSLLFEEQELIKTAPEIYGTIKIKNLILINIAGKPSQENIIFNIVSDSIYLQEFTTDQNTMRNFLLLLIPILFLLLFTNTSFAEENENYGANTAQTVLKETQSTERWVYMGKTKSGFVGFLDIDRFQIDGSKRNVWTKVIYTDEEVFKENNGTKYQAIYTITNRLYDCSNQKVSDIKSIDYDTNGNSYTTDFKKLYRAYPEKRWISIIPGSLGEYLLNFICEYKK